MVTQSINQIEKNLGVSFGYVKKDLLSVNDMVSDLHDKIQHLSLNQAMLVEKIIKLEQKLANKPVAKKTIAKKITKKKAPVKKAKKVTAKPVKKIVKETTVYQ